MAFARCVLPTPEGPTKTQLAPPKTVSQQYSTDKSRAPPRRHDSKARAFRPLLPVYEAGPCGFHLYRHLLAQAWSARATARWV
jgi:hypothetical protein